MKSITTNKNYQKGFYDGWEEREEFENNLEEIRKQYKEWNKYDSNITFWEDITLSVFIGVCIGVVIMMII